MRPATLQILFKTTMKTLPAALLQSRMAFGNGLSPNPAGWSDPQTTLADWCKCGGVVGCQPQCPDTPQCWYMNPKKPGSEHMNPQWTPPGGSVFECHKTQAGGGIPRYTPLRAARNAANFS